MMTVSRSQLGYVGAVLALTVSAIHVMDQGSFTALKDPTYLGVGYWLLEIAGVVAAVLLLVLPRRMAGWLLCAGVAVGPLVGYVLTRTTGLPGAIDDVNNWLEPLGVLSLFTEVTLLMLSATMVSSMRRHAQVREPSERVHAMT